MFSYQSFCCLQVFYKSVKDLEPGEEMLLYARDAVYPENELDAMHTMEDEDGKLPLYLPLIITPLQLQRGSTYN